MIFPENITKKNLCTLKNLQKESNMVNCGFIKNQKKITIHNPRNILYRLFYKGRIVRSEGLKFPLNLLKYWYTNEVVYDSKENCFHNIIS